MTKARKQSELMAMDLGQLAQVVLDRQELGLERCKAANALHARLDEVNGAGWLTLDDHQAIRTALDFDTSQYV